MPIVELDLPWLTFHAEKSTGREKNRARNVKPKNERMALEAVIIRTKTMICNCEDQQNTSQIRILWLAPSQSSV